MRVCSGTALVQVLKTVVTVKLKSYLLSPSFPDICVAPESQGGFEKEQIREQLGSFIGHFSMGRLRRFLSGIIYGNPFRAGMITWFIHMNFCNTFNFCLTTNSCSKTTGHSKSSPSPTPTWMTWWLTTTRKLPAWRMYLRPTWGKALTHGSIFWNTTSQRDHAHCAVWEVNGGKRSTGVWNAPLGARSMSDCMWCPVSIFGTKP